MPTTLPLSNGQLLLVPTSWADVSLGQYVALFTPEAGDTRRPAELLCGLEAGALDNLAYDDVVYIANLIEFAQDPADVLALLPTPGLPDIGTLPYGVMLDAQQYIAEHPDRDALAYSPYLCALYRTQLAFGNIKGPRVAATLAALLALPVTEIYADCAFFLSSYVRSRPGTPPTPKTPMTPMTTKSKPEASGFLTGLGRSLGWTQRPAETS